MVATPRLLPDPLSRDEVEGGGGKAQGDPAASCRRYGQGSVGTGAGGQEEEEEEEEEAATSSDFLSAFAAALEATRVFVCVFDDFSVRLLRLCHEFGGV